MQFPKFSRFSAVQREKLVTQWAKNLGRWMTSFRNWVTFLSPSCNNKRCTVDELVVFCSGFEIIDIFITKDTSTHDKHELAVYAMDVNIQLLHNCQCFNVNTFNRHAAGLQRISETLPSSFLACCIGALCYSWLKSQWDCLPRFSWKGSHLYM